MVIKIRNNLIRIRFLITTFENEQKIEMASTSSSSCDDKSEFNDNPTRDALSEGLMSFLKPNVDSLSKQVENLREKQILLSHELELMSKAIDYFSKKTETNYRNIFQKCADKITKMKHQMTVIGNIFQSVHDRMDRCLSEMNYIKASRKIHFEEFAVST